MISQFEIYLTVENIYFWSNIAVLPLWLLMIFIPNSKITRILTNSIIIPLILAAAYLFVIYQVILANEPILEIFSLYLSLDNL